VLIGVYGSHYPSNSQPTLFEWFQSAGAICAPLEWVWDAGSVQYQTRAGDSTDLAEVGQHYSFADWRRLCADGSVLVGVDATIYSNVVTRMAFKCAPLTATYTDGSWPLEVGAPAPLADVGLGLGTLAQGDCPAGQIATGMNVGTNVGGTSATGLSFHCADPSLVAGQ
jgi:hypothetical protein